MFGNTIRNFPGQGNKKKMITLSPEVKSKLKAEKKAKKKTAKPNARNKQYDNVLVSRDHILVYHTQEVLCGYKIVANLDKGKRKAKDIHVRLPKETSYVIWPKYQSGEQRSNYDWVSHPLTRFVKNIDFTVEMAVLEKHGIDLEDMMMFSGFIFRDRYQLAQIYYSRDTQYAAELAVVNDLMRPSFRPITRSRFIQAVKKANEPEKVTAIPFGHSSQKATCNVSCGCEECECGNSPCDCP